MKILRRKHESATSAKQRLQLSITQQRLLGQGNVDELIAALQDDITELLGQYIAIENDQVQVSLNTTGPSCKLEVNATLPRE